MISIGKTLRMCFVMIRKVKKNQQRRKKNNYFFANLYDSPFTTNTYVPVCNMDTFISAENPTFCCNKSLPCKSRILISLFSVGKVRVSLSFTGLGEREICGFIVLFIAVRS